MNSTLLPVGNAILGRVLNANGEPIDHKGSVEAMRLPLSTPEVLAKTANVPTHLLETGIKVIDLMAPIAYGSVIGFIAGFGLGKEVVAEEIMHHLLTKRQGIAVIAGMRETTYDASSLYEMVREIEVEDRIVMLFEQTTEEISVRQRLLHAATTIAANFVDEGREVLLVIDSQVISTEQMVNLHRFANARGITTLLFVPVNDLHQPTNQALLSELDVQLWFSPMRASQSLWPAIDPLASRSRLLASDAVTLDHRQVAQRVRDLLEHYYELRANMNNAPLGEEQQQTLMRGERIDLFFSQPFVVAEAFTDIPGTYLTREETISSFRALLDGRYDASPTHVFKFVGQIEQS
jgi:F0F1-type ATP synthase beta subunit